MAIWDNWLKNGVQRELEELNKIADPDAVPELRDTTSDDDKIEIARQAILTDPFYSQQSNQTMFKYRLSRLSNKTLKDVSLRDWLTSAIIQNRVDTLLRFSRPQVKKFDMGFRIVKKDQTEHISKAELSEIENLQAFIYNCGRLDNTPDDDKILFGEFLKMTVRDALTFGNIAIEKVLTRGGALHRFRPIPAESVYFVNEATGKAQIEEYVKGAKQTMMPTSDNDPRKDYVQSNIPVDFYKYVQVAFDGRPLAVFGDEDMIFKLFNPQNFADSQGYCYSPVEMAIINITNHMNTENYNSNFFTHGQAAKGVLHLKGTVTQTQMTAFRRQFYNLINGSQNAWRTPIIAGLDDVQWVPMAGGSKDMEYLEYNKHVMRAICTQFQIDPIELGLDALSGGKTSATGDSNESKIEFSREKGLYPILMFLEDFVNNDILPAIDPEYAKKYNFKFEGYADETPQSEVSLLQAEMTVNKSMNDLLLAARKEKITHAVGDLPLNQAFWELCEKNMTRGEIREEFFGDKEAHKKRELQYIPNDPSFIGWQSMLLQIDQLKVQQAQQEQAQQQAQQQEQAQAHQQEMTEADHSREQEKHEAEMAQLQGQAAQNAVLHGKAINVGGKNIKNPLNLDLPNNPN